MPRASSRDESPSSLHSPTSSTSHSYSHTTSDRRFPLSRLTTPTLYTSSAPSSLATSPASSYSPLPSSPSLSLSLKDSAFPRSSISLDDLQTGPLGGVNSARISATTGSRSSGSRNRQNGSIRGDSRASATSRNGGGARGSSQFSSSELDGMLDYGGMINVTDTEVLETLHDGGLSLGGGRESPELPDSGNFVQEGWLSDYWLRGSVKRQRYQSFEGVPYWVSFAQGAQNWDALMTSMLFLNGGTGSTAFMPTPPKLGGEPGPAPSPPKRVLDIGCGTTCLWALQMAKQPGWEATKFVGLDIAPQGVPFDLIPHETAVRLSYVQHNFLQPLPFEDHSFDFVRIASVGLGVPEHQWDDLITEATRVLIPGSPIEILDSNLVVLRKRPRKVSRARVPSNTPYPDLQDDPQASIDEAFDAVLERNFINTHTLGVVPSQLTLNLSSVQSSGLVTFTMPSCPSLPVRCPTPPSPTPTTSSSHSPLMSHSAGTTNRTNFLRTTEAPRILLAAYSERFESSSYGIAHEASSCRLKRHASSGDTSVLRLRHDKMALEFEEAIGDWGNDLRERAGLMREMENRWGWRCGMDEEMLRVLEEETLPVLEERIEVYERIVEESMRERREGEKPGAFDGLVDPEVEFKMSQVVFAKREADVELRAVKRRLGGRVWEAEDEGLGLGTFELGAFVAKAPMVAVR